MTDLSQKKVLALVPARGGSKGIKLKNLQKIGERSLLQITAEFIRDCPFINHGILSTDHEEIANVGRQFGLEVPFMRPEKLSGDLIGDRQLLDHIISDYKDIEDYDILVYLQPTSPLRRNSFIEDCIRAIEKEGYQSAWTVSPVPKKYHPLKVLTQKGDSLDYFNQEGSKIIARQQLSDCYIRNGLCYSWDINYLKKENSALLAPRSKMILVEEEVANIDSIEDLENAKRLLKEFL